MITIVGAGVGLQILPSAKWGNADNYINICFIRSIVNGTYLSQFQYSKSLSLKYSTLALYNVRSSGYLSEVEPLLYSSLARATAN